MTTFPSVHFKYLINPAQGCGGLPEDLPAVIVRRQGETQVTMAAYDNRNTILHPPSVVLVALNKNPVPSIMSSVLELPYLLPVSNLQHTSLPLYLELIH